MKNLNIVLHTRMILIIALSILSSFLYISGHFFIPIYPLTLIGIIMTVLTLLSYRFLLPKFAQSNHIIFSQLLCDCLFLTMIFGVFGGNMNPLTGLYLIPVIYTALLLPIGYSIFTCFMTFASYIAISTYYLPINIRETSPLSMMDLHFFGMTISLGLAAILSTFFVSKLAQNIRAKEKEIEEVKATLAIETQFAKMGIMAASIAHEMNTPLSTLFLIQEELASKQNSPLLIKMTQQLERCQTIIKKILKSFGAHHAESLNHPTLTSFLTTWQTLNPTTPLTHTISQEIHINTYIEDILSNLLENATKASQKIELTATLTHHILTLKITDDGPGLTQAQITQLQTPLIDQLITYKDIPSTHGFGLILTQFLVKRLGGTLTFNPLIITLPHHDN